MLVHQGKMPGFRIFAGRRFDPYGWPTREQVEAAFGGLHREDAKDAKKT
jgi:hypothetical protein